jgi:MYXO-CTERM domain-containing protein
MNPMYVQAVIWLLAGAMLAMLLMRRRKRKSMQ